MGPAAKACCMKSLQRLFMVTTLRDSVTKYLIEDVADLNEIRVGYIRQLLKCCFKSPGPISQPSYEYRSPQASNVFLQMQRDSPCLLPSLLRLLLFMQSQGTRKFIPVE